MLKSGFIALTLAVPTLAMAGTPTTSPIHNLRAPAFVRVFHAGKDNMVVLSEKQQGREVMSSAQIFRKTDQTSPHQAAGQPKHTLAYTYVLAMQSLACPGKASRRVSSVRDGHWKILSAVGVCHGSIRQTGKL